MKKIKDEEKLEFARNLKLLIDSGITINQGLATLIEQTRPGPLRNFLIEAKRRVEAGSSLSSILKESKQFDPIFVNFIKAGEESGRLSECLNYLSQWLDNHITLRKEISSVTFYPKVLIIFATIVALGLSFFVLPKIATILKGLHVKPFVTTRILIAISDILKVYGIHLVLGIVILIFLFLILMRIPATKKIIDILAIKLPVIGVFVRDYQLALISQVAFTLYRSGIPSGKIFQLTAKACSNFCYLQSMEKIADSVIKGTPPSKAMKKFSHLFPPLFISVIALGEETGTLERSFSYLGNFFQERLLRRTRLLPTIIEPILLIIIGLAIAFIASAIILPIYEVTRGI